MDLDETTTAEPEDRSWLIATIFVVATVVVAVLLVLYVLLWNGGAHT